LDTACQVFESVGSGEKQGVEREGKRERELRREREQGSK